MSVPLQIAFSLASTIITVIVIIIGMRKFSIQREDSATKEYRDRVDKDSRETKEHITKMIDDINMRLDSQKDLFMTKFDDINTSFHAYVMDIHKEREHELSLIKDYIYSTQTELKEYMYQNFTTEASCEKNRVVFNNNMHRIDKLEEDFDKLKDQITALSLEIHSINSTLTSIKDEISNIWNFLKNGKDKK